MLPFKSAIGYFWIFRKYLGGRLYLVSVLTLFAAMTEGVGIALLLPLLGLLGVTQNGGVEAVNTVAGPSASSTLEGLVREMVAVVGVQNSMPGILIFISMIILIKGVLKFAEGAYHSHLRAVLLQEVQGRLFAAYSTMGYAYYSHHSAGHFTNLISVQVPRLTMAFERYKRFLTALITVLAYFIFAFLMSWPFATMATLAGVSMLIVFRRLTALVERWSRQGASEHGTLNHFLIQTLQAYKYLAATAQIGRLRAEVFRSISRVAGFERRKEIAWSFTEALQEPLAVAVLVVIIVIQIVVLEQPLAPAIVGLALIYRAMGQLVLVQGHWQATMQDVGSLELVEGELDSVATSREPTGTKILRPLTHGISLQGVSFSYDNAVDSEVLQDVTLTIPANQTVAIVGASGAGKTTLVDLLTLMLRPVRGELRIDGVSHEDADLSSWRAQIGYVSQDTIVFDDTIGNNICLWAGNYSTDAEVRHQVERAALQAGAKSFIDELPDGFNTRVGDRGVRLSGGQRQRLFIARELYKNPRLLILDEATSALDSESEMVIKETVGKLRGSTTVLIVAHRLSTIRDADYVYVLDAGRIIECGTYEELAFARGGTFHRMIALQQL